MHARSDMPAVLNRLPENLAPLVALDAVRVSAGQDFSRPLVPGRRVWVQASEGHIYVCGAELRSGDGVLLENETLIAAWAESDSLLLLAEFKAAEKPRNI